MKKSIFLLAGVLLLGSCGEKEYYAVSITNESSKSVSYVYNDFRDTLGASETKAYEVKAHTEPPANVADTDGFASITMQNYQGEKYTFKDAEELKLSVLNTLPIEITIWAENYIDNKKAPPDHSAILTISENDTIPAGDPSPVIYTRNPKFITDPSYPSMTVEWHITKAKNAGDPDEMTVIIR